MDYTLDYEPDDELDYESERASADTAEDLIFEVLNNGIHQIYLMTLYGNIWTLSQTPVCSPS